MHAFVGRIFNLISLDESENNALIYDDIVDRHELIW